MANYYTDENGVTFNKDTGELVASVFAEEKPGSTEQSSAPLSVDADPESAEMVKVARTSPAKFLTTYDKPRDWVLDEKEAQMAQILNSAPGKKSSLLGSLTYSAGELLRTTYAAPRQVLGAAELGVAALQDAFYPNAETSAIERWADDFGKLEAQRERNREEYIDLSVGYPTWYGVGAAAAGLVRDLAITGGVAKLGAMAASRAAVGKLATRAVEKEVAGRYLGKVAAEGAQKAAGRAIETSVFAQEIGGGTVDYINQYIDQTGDYSLKYYDPDVDLPVNVAVALLSAKIEKGLGVERFVPELVARGYGAKIPNLAQVAMRGGEGLIGEAGEAGLQNFIRQVGDMISGYREPGDFDTTSMLTDIVLGGALGFGAGAGMHYINRRAMINRLQEQGLDRQTAADLVDTIASNEINKTINDFSAMAELNLRNGEAYEKMKAGIKNALEIQGWEQKMVDPTTGETLSVDEYIDLLTNTQIVNRAVTEAINSSLPIDTFLDIAEFVNIDNFLTLRPLGDVEQIRERIAEQDAIINRQKELKKTGAENKQTLDDAKTKKAILQKVLTNKLLEQEIQRVQIENAKTPEINAEIETATTDADTLGKSDTAGDFVAQVSNQAQKGKKPTTAQINKRMGNALIKRIFGRNKTDFDAVMVMPEYAGARAAITNNASRIIDYVKKHRKYGILRDLRNALKLMQTVNQGNFLNYATTPALDGVDVTAQNAFLYHFLFSDANTTTAYIDAYLQRAEASISGETQTSLSKKDLVMEAFKATDDLMQTQALVNGTEYVSIYDESGALADKNVAAVLMSYQNQFASDGRVLEQAEFLPKEDEKIEYVDELNKAKESKKNVSIKVGRLPFVYTLLGFKSGEVRTSKNIIIKDTETKHSVPMEIAEKIPELYSDPLMVFQSATHSDRLVAVLDAKDANGNQIILALSPNKKEVGGYHFIPSFYGKEEFDSFVERNIKQGRLKYVKDLAVSDTLQLRTQALQGLDTSNIILKSDIVNKILPQGRVVNGFYDPELSVILLGKNWNTMTLPHEFAHYWLTTIFNVYKRVQSGELTARPEWVAEKKEMFALLGIDENQAAPTRTQQEKFATMTEAYLTGIGVTGDVPQTFKEYFQWVPEKYKGLQQLAYLDEQNRVQNVLLDAKAVEFFNKWYENPTLSSLSTSPERQRLMNVTGDDGETVKVNPKEMNDREKEWAQDAEEQRHTDERLYNTLDENMPADIKPVADGQKEVIKSRSNFLKTTEEQKRRWFERKSRDKEAKLAQRYLEKNPEHAREVIFGDPELVPNDTGIDRATLINAYMALNNITPDSPEWATLHTNIAINQSLAGTQLALSNDKSYGVYLDALREVESALEDKAAVNYTGSRWGARERFNRDIQRFLDRELPAIFATAPNTTERETALRVMFEKARTTFSGNTTGAFLNQVDINYAKAQRGKTDAFMKWATNQIKKGAGAKLNAEQQTKLLQISAKAQMALVDMNNPDAAKAIAAVQELRNWQMEKEKLMGVSPRKFSLLADWAPRAMLASFNTLVVANVPSTAMNTAVVRLAQKGIFGKNAVSQTLIDNEIKRIKAIYNATSMNFAQMEKPTSPSLLHGESYATGAQKWYDPYTILGREDNFFRVPTFVNTLAQIASTDAKASGRSADEVFTEYLSLDAKTDEAKLARKQALAVANMAVFTQNGGLSRMLNHMRAELNAWSRSLFGFEPKGFGLGTLLAPFLTTGANIAEMGVRGAIAPITTITTMVNSWRTGKAIDPMKKLALRMDWTYFVFSAASMALLAALTSDDDDFYADPYRTGMKYDPNKPYDAINIAGVWLDLDFFGPFAIPMRTAAKAIQAWKTDNGLDAIGKGYAESAKMVLGDVPLAETIVNNQFNWAVRKPGSFAGSYAYNQANKLVPAILKPVSRAITRGYDIEFFPWKGTTVGRKFNRNYGFDGQELTTQDLIELFTIKAQLSPELQKQFDKFLLQ